MDKVLAAATFASKKHAKQFRKNASHEPYINHPLEVANILSLAGITDPDVLAAAILHDTVEDTATTMDELRHHFGERVAGIVAEVSDDKSLPKVERKRLQIEHAAHASFEAKLVKMADKISNLSSLSSDPPTTWSPEVVKGYVIWSFRVVESIRECNAVLDGMLGSIFETFGVTQVDDSMLESYFTQIQ